MHAPSWECILDMRQAQTAILRESLCSMKQTGLALWLSLRLTQFQTNLQWIFCHEIALIGSQTADEEAQSHLHYYRRLVI